MIDKAKLKQHIEIAEYASMRAFRLAFATMIKEGEDNGINAGDVMGVALTLLFTDVMTVGNEGDFLKSVEHIRKISSIIDSAKRAGQTAATFEFIAGVGKHETSTDVQGDSSPTGARD